MTYYDAYVGDLADPEFKWEGGDWNGNTPRGLTRPFPPVGNRNLYFSVIELARSHRFEGKQTDWGAWVVKVTKRDLIEIVDEWYGRDSWYTDRSHMPHLYDRLEDVRRTIENLDDETECALVGTEL